METFSALLAICAGNSPVTGESPAQRPLTRSLDVFFDLRLNERSSKQSWSCWFETLSRLLWRHRDVLHFLCTHHRSPFCHVPRVIEKCFPMPFHGWGSFIWISYMLHKIVVTVLTYQNLNMLLEHPHILYSGLLSADATIFIHFVYKSIW